MSAILTAFVDAQETYRNYTRPTIYASIEAVLKFFNIQGISNIVYNGEAEISKLLGTDFTGDPNESLYTEGGFRNKIYVAAEVERSPFNSGYHNQRRMGTEAYFWHDPAMRFNIAPEFEGRNVRVEIIAHFTSRQAAQQFVNRISMTTAQLITNFTFDPIAHMPINSSILELVKNVHELQVKNLIRPADEEWIQYFDDNTKQQLFYLENKAGNHPTLAFPVKIRDVIIQFEDPEIRLAQKGEIFGQYEVGFSYVFFHNEFMGWRLEYPLQVHQDQIADGFIPPIREEYIQPVPAGLVAPEFEAGAFMTDNGRLTQAPYRLVLPQHDKWHRRQRDGLVDIIQARIRTEPVPGEQLLCNAFEIPGIEWNDVAKEYILRNHAKAFTHHATPFLFEVYSDDLQVLPEQLRMDAAGNVYMTRQPSHMRVQHLVINIDYDYDNYNDALWDDVRKNDGKVIPGIYPWWDWDTVPDDWNQTAPKDLPVLQPLKWNLYMSSFEIIAKNINAYKEQ